MSGGNDSIGVIDVQPSHTAITGRPAIELYALLQLRSGLKLELRCPGMKFSRMGSALKFAKQRTGLRTNDRAKHIERLDLMIEELRAHVIWPADGEDET